MSCREGTSSGAATTGRDSEQDDPPRRWGRTDPLRESSTARYLIPAAEGQLPVSCERCESRGESNFSNFDLTESRFSGSRDRQMFRLVSELNWFIGDVYCLPRQRRERVLKGWLQMYSTFVCIVYAYAARFVTKVHNTT